MSILDKCLNFTEKQNKHLIRNSMMLSKVLGDNKVISYNQPEGGLFAFLNIKKTNMKSDDFCTKLIKETGVVLIPGINFGRNWDDHVRITISAPTQDFEEGIKLIDNFANNL